MDAYYAGIIPYEGKFSVIFPDVPGCATWGETYEHAFTMAIEALASHLEALADDGDPIPAPSTRDKAMQLLVEEYASLELGDLPVDTVLQLIPAPELDMRNKTISVSFRKYILDMIDRKAQSEGMTRSGFLAKAATEYNHLSANE